MSTLGKKYAKFTAITQISLTPAMLAALRARARNKHRSVASIVREAVARYLRDLPDTRGGA